MLGILGPGVQGTARNPKIWQSCNYLASSHSRNHRRARISRHRGNCRPLFREFVGQLVWAPRQAFTTPRTHISPRWGVDRSTELSHAKSAWLLRRDPRKLHDITPQGQFPREPGLQFGRSACRGFETNLTQFVANFGLLQDCACCTA